MIQGHFLPRYQEEEIVKQNPFATIDQIGVGALVKIAVEKGRKTRPEIKLGICGEHGGDPASVKFFSSDWAELCQLLAVPRAHCPPGPRPKPPWKKNRNPRASPRSRFKAKGKAKKK